MSQSQDRLPAREAALKGLAERREKAQKTARVSNESLPAGSPMYYYCRMCRINHDCRSEDDFSRVNPYCTQCATDMRNGLLSASD